TGRSGQRLSRRGALGRFPKQYHFFPARFSTRRLARGGKPHCGANRRRPSRGRPGQGRSDQKAGRSSPRRIRLISMSDWVKAMGMDYGAARIGIAVSDDIGLLAHPLETVPAADPDRAADRIAALVRERKTEDLVV